MRKGKLERRHYHRLPPPYAASKSSTSSCSSFSSDLRSSPTSPTSSSSWRRNWFFRRGCSQVRIALYSELDSVRVIKRCDGSEMLSSGCWGCLYRNFCNVI